MSGGDYPTRAVIGRIVPQTDVEVTVRGSAGAVTLAAARVGDLVLFVYDEARDLSITHRFEGAITVSGQLQQVYDYFEGPALVRLWRPSP
jgi:hypothetical protein